MAEASLHRTLILLLTASIGFLLCREQATAQEWDCHVPTRFYDSEPILPKTTTALARGQAVLIVVIGGASTLGRAAGGAHLAWPARLGVALTQRFPSARVKVDNRAVARQTTQEMVARLDREVIAVHPTLVIWETGTTDAVAGTDLDEFRQAMQAGIDRLRASEVEMAFMDMQFSREMYAVLDFNRYGGVVREVTDANNIPLFQRHDIMQHWIENGLLDLQTTGHDQVRMVASRLYNCIGQAMADFVTRGLQPHMSLPPSRAGSPQ